MGAGYVGSTIRNDLSKGISFDFHFHIKREYFQAGILMSGPEFLSNNNIQGHLGYGLRKEKNNVNFAAFGGITYFTGVLAISDSIYGSIPFYYQGAGVYISAQAVTKFTYDIGAGVEVFAEYSPKQSALGLKLILFFSGAYVGPKKNYNPNVRSESGR